MNYVPKNKEQKNVTGARQGWGFRIQKEETDSGDHSLAQE